MGRQKSTYDDVLRKAEAISDNVLTIREHVMHYLVKCGDAGASMNAVMEYVRKVTGRCHSGIVTTAIRDYSRGKGRVVVTRGRQYVYTVQFSHDPDGIDQPKNVDVPDDEHAFRSHAYRRRFAIARRTK